MDLRSGRRRQRTLRGRALQNHRVQPYVAGLISKMEVQLRSGIGRGCAKVDYVLTPINAYRDGAIHPEAVNVAAILNHGKPDRAHGIGLGPELEPYTSPCWSGSPAGQSYTAAASAVFEDSKLPLRTRGGEAVRV